MPALANPVNAAIQGFQSVNTTSGAWIGRTMTPGTGILITDGDGTAGNPVFSADGSVLIEKVALDTGISPIVPIAGEIVLTGATVVAGTHPIRTDGTASNTATIEVQISQAIAATDATKIGLSNFNSNQFTVDANGFVSIVGGAAITKVEVDAFTGPGTNPVLPDGTGKITVTGNQVAAGMVPTVIRTDSLSANTYTIEIQRSQAVASSTVGDNGVCHFNSSQFNVDSDGFVTIISTGAIEKIAVDAHTAPGTNPVLPDGSGQITVTGGQVAAGTTTNVIRTDSLAANTYTVEIQRSQAVSGSTIGDNGVSHFDSKYFTVDANGFVSIHEGSLLEGVIVDVFTAPGTDPVVPDVNGHITVTGAQIAAGTTPNVIRTDSLLPNTYTIEIQRSQAVASSTLADNGVCHFNSADFTVDANGFVSLLGGAALTKIQVDTFTGPGTNPVVPDGTGKITVTGNQVAAGTIPTVIRTDSLAANTYTIEIQRSQAVASSTVGENGVCHFNSADFTVDSNGFVSLLGGAALTKIGVDTFTGPGTNPVLPDGTGKITVTGGQVAAGTTTNVIRTDSLAANTYTVEVQRSQAVASSTVGDNGVCHFNSADFTVDSNGFVSSIYYSLTPYIVGSDIHSQYSTIASAIAQAVSDGASSSNPKTIYIKPQSGGYTENLTLSDGINLQGFGTQTSVTGKITMTAAGSASVSKLILQTNSDFCIAVTGASASLLTVNNCTLNLANNTGISFTSSSASSVIIMYDCSINLLTTGITYYNMSSPGSIVFENCFLGNSGLSLTPTVQSAGAVNMFYVHCDGPIATSGTATIGLFTTNIIPGAIPINVTALTVNGTGLSSAYHSVFASGSASGISIGAGASFQLTHSTVTSGNVNALTGAGTLFYAYIAFGNGGTSGHNVTTETSLGQLT